MWGTIALLVLAVGLHYALEYSINYSDYECPTYCETDHEHIKKKEKNND